MDSDDSSMQDSLLHSAGPGGEELPTILLDGRLLDEMLARQKRASDATQPYDYLSAPGWQAPRVEELAGMIPGCEVESFIARGGMGAVYRARQTRLGRLVAVKLLPRGTGPEDAELVERFTREARAMAKSNHPAILPIYELGETKSGLLYYVMEHVDGCDLAAAIRLQRRLDPAHAIAICIHVCEALEFAHRKGIIHRDIKPSNIMLSRQGVVKVADFGLAKFIKGEIAQLTLPNALCGTPEFLAPELMRHGTAQATPQTDIFALGVSLYQMVTGVIPRGAYLPPSQRVPTIDPRLDAVIEKAMAQRAEDRYADAGEMRSALQEVLLPAKVVTRPPAVVKEPVTPPPPVPQDKEKPVRLLNPRHPGAQNHDARPRGRSRRTLGALAAVALLGVLGTGAFFWSSQRGREPASPGAQAVATVHPAVPEPLQKPVTITKPSPAPSFKPVGPPPEPQSPPGYPEPISRWEAEGDARDSVDGNHGTIHGEVGFADGIYGKAFLFNGGYVEVPDAPSLHFGPDSHFTISLWAYRTDATLPTHLFGKRSDKPGDPPDSQGPHGYQLGLDRATPATPLNEWTLWTLVYDGAFQSLYINGVPALDWKKWGKLHAPDETPLKIGASGVYRAFRGKIDDVRLYNRALPATEIKALSDMGKARLAQSQPPAAPAPTPPDPALRDATKDQPFVNSLGMKFVPVPGTDILMCIHETRKRDYAQYAAANPGTDDRWKKVAFRGIPVSDGIDHPVVLVSWKDAKAFCAWLGKKEGHAYRLATGIEWTAAAGNHLYPWGDEWPPPKGAGNFADSSLKGKFSGIPTISGYTDGYATTAPVMSFPPNPLGIYDLSGNVWEFTEDWAAQYSGYVVRGGAWLNDNPVHLRSTNQSYYNSDYRYSSHGFRCVVETGHQAGAVAPPSPPAPLVPAISVTDLEEKGYADITPADIARAAGLLVRKEVDGSDGQKLLPGTWFICKTEGGHFGKFKVDRLQGTSLVLSWVVFNEDGSVRTSGSNLVVGTSYTFNLETGSVPPPAGKADFEWHGLTASTRVLAPSGTVSRFLLVHRATPAPAVTPSDINKKGYANITAADIAASTTSKWLTKEQINGSDGHELPPGTWFICRTNEGHFGKFKVDKLQGTSLVLSWVVFNEDGSVRFSGSNLGIEPSYTFSLETGSVPAPAGKADFQWYASAASTRFLVPEGNSLLLLVHRAKGTSEATPAPSPPSPSVAAISPKVMEEKGYADMTSADIVAAAMNKLLTREQVDGSEGNELLPGTWFICKTCEGHFGKFKVDKLEGKLLVLSWVVFNEGGSLRSSGSNLAVGSSYYFSLETGTVGVPTEKADFLWSPANALNRFLAPANSSRFLLVHRAKATANNATPAPVVSASDRINAVDKKGYANVTAADITGLAGELSKEKIDGSDGKWFRPGTWFICKTSEGRFGKFKVDKLEVTALVLTWVVFNGDGSVHCSGSNLVVRRSSYFDLDMGTLTRTSAAADFFWEDIKVTTRFLVPEGGTQCLLVHRAYAGDPGATIIPEPSIWTDTMGRRMGAGPAPIAGKIPAHRTWKDTQGNTTVADFVNLKDDTVTLRMPTGEVMSLPLSRFSAEDQAYAKTLVPK